MLPFSHGAVFFNCRLLNDEDCIPLEIWEKRIESTNNISQSEVSQKSLQTQLNNAIDWIKLKIRKMWNVFSTCPVILIGHPTAGDLI